MRTVGQILKEEREARFYSLEDVEKQTKIRKELLEALEADDYTKLPPPTFVQGFIKNYGKFLGLDIEKLLPVFRRDFEATKHPPLVMESFSKPIGGKRFSVTPSSVIGLAIALIVLGFFTYLWVEYRQYVGAPTLEVTSPKEGQTVDILQVVVEGKTDPEARVEVNSQGIVVDQSGGFKEEIKLSSSVNNVTITATGKFGQATTVERTVVVRQ